MTASSEDRILGGRVHLRQPDRGFRVAIDSVLLAAAVPCRPGDRVLDLGCGSGAVALCLLARMPEVDVTGVESRAHLAALAGENAALNGMQERFRCLQADVRSLPPDVRGHFHHVTTNPPFQRADASRASREPDRQASMREEVPLERWIAAALWALRPKGWLTVIHRADRMADILMALEGKAGDTAVLPLWPREGAPARRIVLCARKGSRAPLRLLPGLILHTAEGSFTAAAEAILRHAEPLSLGAAGG